MAARSVAVGTVPAAASAFRVPHITICGHSDNGAMKALCGPVKHGPDNLPTVRSWLRNAEAAHSVVRAAVEDLSETDMVAGLVRQNVALPPQHLRTHPAVATSLACGRISVHGWIFDIGAASIDALDEVTGALMPLATAEHTAT